MISQTRSLVVLDKLSEPGGKFNEDRIFHDDHTAWVFDGATSLTNSKRTAATTDASWLVQTAIQTLPSISNLSLDNQLLRLVRALRDQYPTVRGPLDKSDLPSAVGAGIRLNRSSLEFCHFGDCALIIQDHENAEIYHSPESRLQELDREVIQQISKVRSAEQLNLSEARQKVLPFMRANRELGNTANGYGNLSVLGELPRPRKQGSFKIQVGAHGLIASDGFMALAEDYGKYSFHGLLEAGLNRGLDNLYSELRETEAEDRDCLKFPRLKPSDDASAILFEIG